MMGKRSPQDKRFAADHVYLDFVGRDTLYGYLAQNRSSCFAMKTSRLCTARTMDANPCLPVWR